MYDGESALEAFHPLRGIKERLKRICTSLYRRCNSVYESNKKKRPKAASIFKTFADFFKKHSTLVDKIDSKEEAQKETDAINDAHKKVVRAYRYTDIDGSTHDFDNKEDFDAFNQKKEDEHQRKLKENREREAEQKARDEKLRSEQQKRMETEWERRQMKIDKENEEWEKQRKEKEEKKQKDREKQERLQNEKSEYKINFIKRSGVREPSSYIKDLCKTKDLSRIRERLALDCIINSHNFKADLEYAKKSVPGLFEEHKEFYEDNIYRRPKLWKKRTQELRDLLGTNFSQKRLKDTMLIMKMIETKLS